MTDAMDDVPDHARTPARSIVVAFAVLLPLLVVASLLVLPGVPLPRYQSHASWASPTAPTWPRPARAGERLLAAGAGEVRVQAATASEASALAAALERADGAASDPVARARETLRRAWADEMVIGPIPTLSPAADGAAWLRARAIVARGLTAASPQGGVGTAPLSQPDAAAEAIAAAARSGDEHAIRVALERDMDAERGQLASGSPGDPNVATAWALAWNQRAEWLESEADAIEASTTPFQRELVRAVLPERAWALIAQVPAPATAAPIGLPPARPNVALWTGLLALGVGLGASSGVLVARIPRRGAREYRDDASDETEPEFVVDAAYEPESIERAEAFEPIHAPEPDVAPPVAAAHAHVPAPHLRTDPEPAIASPEPLVERSEPWLHVVGGTTAGGIGRGALELAARWLARGERVVLVDAGRKVGLHRFLGRDHRWGLAECLSGEAPALGVVQDAGMRRFYLLAHGAGDRRPDWSQLGQLLEDLRPHFGRVVLAFDAEGLEQRAQDLARFKPAAWWSGARPKEKRLDKISRELHSPLIHLELEDMPRASVEGLVARVGALAAALPPVPVAAAPRIETPPAAPTAIEDPALVMDCDLRVRERLRFLIWMRRVRNGENATDATRPDPERVHSH